MISKERAIELLLKMPKKYKPEVNIVVSYLRENKLGKAYRYVNYEQLVQLKYKMPQSVWTYLIAQQTSIE